jgi:ribosome-binding protein aMBF1 (putative translation factor)
MQLHKKQAGHFESLRADSMGGLKVVPFAPRGRLTGRFEVKQEPATFEDTAYLHQVILFLKQTRQRQGLSLAKLTKKAGLKRGVIERAERNSRFPTTREFKDWSKALGLVWENVWTAALPQRSEYTDHQTQHVSILRGTRRAL